MVIGFLKGLGYSLKGLRTVFMPGIRRFVLIPLCINIILFGAGVYLLFDYFPQWMEALMPDFPEWLSWLETGLHWLLWPLFAIMVVLLVFYSFTFIANLLAAPFNSLLAEKVEAMLEGEVLKDVSLIPTWKIVVRSLSSELGKLIYFLKWLLLLLIISLIPVVNILAPLLWIILGAWMLALEYLDYPMGNHGHFFKEINQQAVSDRVLSLGFGVGVLFMTSIPLLNFFAMPSGVAGATTLWVRQGRVDGNLSHA